MSPAEVARLTGVSSDTLRHYERKGLLPAVPRTAAGYRTYPQALVARVHLIRRALAVGFSLADLARVLRERDRGGAPCRQVHALVSERLAALDRELAALVELKRDLQGILEDWDARLAATPPGAQARLLDVIPGQVVTRRSKPLRRA